MTKPTVGVVVPANRLPLGDERLRRLEQEERAARDDRARKARALEVAKLAAVIYAGTQRIAESVNIARALLAEAERTEP